MKKFDSGFSFLAAKYGYTVSSVLCCILGIVFIAVPSVTVNLIGILCGILLIIFGCVRLLSYFSSDILGAFFRYDLYFGIISIVIGLLMLLNPESLMRFICIALGASVFFDSVFKIWAAFKSRLTGQWQPIIIISAISAVLGIVLMFRPGGSSKLFVVIFGITLLAEGIQNLFAAFSASKAAKKQKDEVVIEVEYKEK